MDMTLKIINEHLKSLSIKMEIKTHAVDIATLSKQRTSLNNSILSLESRISMNKQTLDSYSRLEVMNFGHKGINQLWFTILEIGGANSSILCDESVSKFLKNIEDEYDTKLGFKSKVQEKRMN